MQVVLTLDGASIAIEEMMQVGRAGRTCRFYCLDSITQSDRFRHTGFYRSNFSYVWRKQNMDYGTFLRRLHCGGCPLVNYSTSSFYWMKY